MLFISSKKIFYFWRYSNFCPYFFGFEQKWLHKKAKAIFKILDVSNWKQIITMHSFSCHALQSGPGPGPGPLEKADPIPKFIVWVKDSQVWQIRGCWFQIRQKFLKILTQKYPNEAFLVPNLGIFIFSRNFTFSQI